MIESINRSSIVVVYDVSIIIGIHCINIHIHQFNDILIHSFIHSFIH